MDETQTNYPLHDQITTGSGTRCPGSRGGSSAGVRLEILQTRLHATPALRHAGRPRVPQDRLPRHGGTASRLVRPAPGPRLGQGPRPFHPPESPRALARKKGVDALVDATIRSAQERGLIPARARAAVDATGL